MTFNFLNSNFVSHFLVVRCKKKKSDEVSVIEHEISQQKNISVICVRILNKLTQNDLRTLLSAVFNQVVCSERNMIYDIYIYIYIY